MGDVWLSVQVLVIYIFLEISPCPLSFQMYWNKAVRVCYVLVLSCVWLCGTPWTVACQALVSMEFSRQEHWSGLPFPSPRPRDQTQVSSIAGRFFTIWVTREARDSGWQILKLALPGALLRSRLCCKSNASDTTWTHSPKASNSNSHSFLNYHSRCCL